MPHSPSPPAWQALLAPRDEPAATRLGQLWRDDPQRGSSLSFSCAGLAVDFSKQRIAAQTIPRLAALARERGLAAAVEGLFTGRRVNSTENRPALHTALRGGEHVVVDGTDLRPQLQRAHERMRVFAEAVRDGLWKGVRGARFTHVLAIGIGGSAPAPRLGIGALRGQAHR